eukprot:CCRYP_019335-RC/>CCRYP_019335-RC protein AED:0.20 eAED:0.20 QI:800/0.5/0.6/1/0/0/5/1285/132
MVERLNTSDNSCGPNNAVKSPPPNETTIFDRAKRDLWEHDSEDGNVLFLANSMCAELRERDASKSFAKQKVSTHEGDEDNANAEIDSSKVATSAGLNPLSSAIVSSAPASTRSSTTDNLPVRAASQRGVHPK